MSEDNYPINAIMEDSLAGAEFRSFSTKPPRTLDQAYALQDALSASLIRHHHRKEVCGWKIAANSATLLERFKLEEPLSGRIFDDQKLETGAQLSLTNYRQFAFEPEIAAIMGSDLPALSGPLDDDIVTKAINRLVPAVELIDMRDIQMEGIHLPDVVAQNISNVGAIIGGPGVAPEALDVSAVRTQVSVNGTQELDVTGAAPQTPLEAVKWLAEHLSSRGLALSAGQVVLCGTHSPIWYLEQASEVEITMSGLGQVGFNLS